MNYENRSQKNIYIYYISCTVKLKLYIKMCQALWRMFENFKNNKYSSNSYFKKLFVDLDTYSTL